MRCTPLSLAASVLTVLVFASVPLSARAGDKFEHLATVRAERTLEKTVQSLELKTRTGNIEIVRAKGKKLEITADVRVDRGEAENLTNADAFDQHVAISSKEGVLTITDAHMGALDRKAWHVAMKIALPRPLDIEALTGAGDLCITFAGGDVALRTGAGSVTVKCEATRSLSVTAGAGDVELVLGAAAGPISANSGAGNLTLQLDQPGASKAVSLHSGAGDVALKLQPEACGRFELSAGVGSIATTGCEGIKIRKHGVGTTAAGAIGKGGPVYEVSTGVGSIRLSRK